MEITNYRHCGLLRPRWQRPHGSRAAESQDELAPPQVEQCSVPPRGRQLVLRSGSEVDAAALGNLPRGAIVGTSSQRRLAQLRCWRDDLVIKDLRGNVDTRIRKLDEGQYDAVILASAGLVRLGLQDRISLRIEIEQMLPAVGQGAIAIETRSDDEFAVEATRRLDHHETRLACLAERAFLRGLGGGCQLPIAAHARFEGELLKLDGAGHGFKGKDAETAEKAMIAFFDKHLKKK